MKAKKISYLFSYMKTNPYLCNVVRNERLTIELKNNLKKIIMKDLTAKKVIEFMFSEQEMNNSIVSATIGNGGSGLDIRVWNAEPIQELEDLKFDGKVEPCIDIEESGYYNSDCSVYQFSDEDGFKIQILTF